MVIFLIETKIGTRLRLYIAEKPELSKAIAEAIDGHKERGDGYIK